MRCQQDFKQTEIGRIPNGWRVVELSQIGGIITGTTPSTKVEEYWGEGYPFVTPTDYSGEKYVYETERTVTKHGAEKARLIPKDSIMVVCIASVGEVAMASIECITNQQINTIVCNQETDQHYVYYAMAFSKSRLKTWAGITTSPIIKKSLFEKFPLPLPSLPEQKKIAEILSTADQAIEKVSEAIEKTQKLKKGFMQELLTKGIGHKEFKDTEIGRIPKEWNIGKLGEVITLCQYGLSIPMSQEGEYPIVKMDDIINGYVVANKVKYVNLDKRGFENFRLRKGDVLFNRTNSYELVGRTGIFLLDGDYVFASYLIRLRPNSEVANPFYLTTYLMFSGEKLRQIATRAVHQANINATTLQKVIIPVPPLPEQQKIAEILSGVDERLELLRRRKEKLEKIKRGLMDDLLTGKVRVELN
jgi:type I restriction enzyme S subunit